MVDLGEVVVSANRTPTEAAKVGSTVSRLSGDEIRKQGQPILKESLGLLPGISLSQNGGLGTSSTFIMRGANQTYVKVLVDGMDISDPSSTQTQPAFEHLLSGGVERVEVLKGSQSTLYGGDAVAGVIDISNAAERGSGITHKFDADYGSFDTGAGTYALNAGFERGDFALRIGGVKSQNISAADENAGNTETDPYENLTISGTGSFDLNDFVTLFGSARHVNARTEFDNGFPVEDAINFYGTNEQAGGRIGATVTLLDGRLQNTVSFQHYQNERRFIDSFPGTFDGNRNKADAQTTFEFNDMITLMAGAAVDHTNAVSTNDFSRFDASAETIGGWGQIILSPVEQLTLTAGGRLDSHDQFGDFDTYRFTAAYDLEQTGTIIRGSAASGYRAPSLFELFSPDFGTPGLQPETSKSYDIGVEQRLLEDRLRLGATYFVLNTSDLIEFDFVTSTYRNVAGTTDRDGVELTASLAPVDWARFGPAYTYTHTETAGGERLARVPLHEVGASIDVTPIEKLNISITGKFVFDVFDSGERPLDDYVLVNARVGYQVRDNVELFARVQNLLDQEYQTVIGYGTPDLAVYGGVLAEF